jgi:glucose-6-phosphate isomerase
MSVSETHTREEGFNAALGSYGSAVDRAVKELFRNRIVTRIWEHDHTVWKPDPDQITNRLGWLHIAETMASKVSELTAFSEQMRQEGLTHALLLGMGGSSLAPQVFRLTFGVRPGHLDLSVLDSTDPRAVVSLDRKLEPAKTLYIASTKSGGTVETLSFLKYFYNRATDSLGEEAAGSHFIAITDPGSSLEALATELGFRRAFLNDPTIGGRYSALSYFGLVPAALVGVDLNTLLQGAIAAANAIHDHPLSPDSPAVQLGAIMGELAASGRDKLTLVLSPSIAPWGAWVEQLIAESTGKEGKGILPVDGEALLPPDAYGRDRLFVHLQLAGEDPHGPPLAALEQAGHPVVRIRLESPYDLGREFFQWEMATAIAGHQLGINPFDQPNVESSKAMAREMLAAYEAEGSLPEPPPTVESEGIMAFADRPATGHGEVFRHLFSLAHTGESGSPRSYVALQAYLEPSAETDGALSDLRRTIQRATRMATTTGYGPRFLHSTGQLHKGDAGHGLFIQFTDHMPHDEPIPDAPGRQGSSVGFGILKMAQALGDYQAQLDAGRKVVRFHFTGDAAAGLRQLARSAEEGAA